MHRVNRNKSTKRFVFFSLLSVLFFNNVVNYQQNFNLKISVVYSILKINEILIL